MNKKYIFVSVLILNQSIYLFTFAFTHVTFFAFLIFFVKTSRPSVVTLHEAFVNISDTQCTSKQFFFLMSSKPGFTIFLLYYLVYIGTFKSLLELCILILNMQLKPSPKLLDTF